MEQFILALEVVFPIFLPIGLGFYLRQKGVFTQEGSNELNKSVFQVGLPILIFHNIYNTKVKEVWDTKLLVVAILFLLGMLVISAGITHMVEKDPRKQSVLIQCGYRSNLVLFGLPISAALFGEENLGTASLMVAVIVPLYNIIAVVLLSLYQGRDISVKKVGKTILTNPMIIGTLLGMFFVFTQIRIPDFILKGVGDLGRMASPLALLGLGTSLTISSIKSDKKQVLLGVALRLLIMPSIFLSLAVWLGYRGAPLVSFLAMTGAPVSVASYSMAKTMGADGELASLLVLFTAAGSLITLFLWIVLLKQTHLI